MLKIDIKIVNSFWKKNRKNVDYIGCFIFCGKTHIPLVWKNNFYRFLRPIAKVPKARKPNSVNWLESWYMRERDTRRSQLNVGLQTIFYFASWSETSIFSYCANASMGKNMLMWDRTLSDFFYKLRGYLSPKRTCFWW